MTPRTTHQPRLLTFRSGGWVLLLAGISTLVLFIWAVAGIGRPLIGKHGDLASYGFDLTTCLIPQDQIVTGGLKKDALRALTDPPVAQRRLSSPASERSSSSGRGMPEIVVTAFPRRPFTSRRTRTTPSPRSARGFFSAQVHFPTGRPQEEHMRPSVLL